VNQMLSAALSQSCFTTSTQLRTVLDHFRGVYLVDSTRLKSGEKLLTCLNLSTGQIQLEMVDAQVHDNAIALAHQTLPVGALRLGDLGFFDLKAFAKLQQHGTYWLSRYKSRTVLLCRETEQRLDLLALCWLYSRATARCANPSCWDARRRLLPILSPVLFPPPKLKNVSVPEPHERNASNK
jgi:hypothetical protein